MRAAFRAKALEKTGLREIETGVGRNRLEDDGGDLAWIVSEYSAHGLEVVERKRDREAGKFLRDAGTVGLSVGKSAAARVDEERIDMPMIAAFKFDDLVAPGEAARQSNARHGRFGPAVDHPDLFNRRNPATDQFRHLDLERIWNSKADGAGGGFAHGIDYDRRGMPEDRRSPRADIVDVFLSIDVPDVGPSGAIDEKRLASQTAKGAHGRIDSTGNAQASAGKKFRRKSGHRA